MERRKSVAARAGRWSALHRRRAIVSWLVFVVLAAIAGSAVGLKTLESDQYGIGSSGRADQAISDNFPKRATEDVLVQSRVVDVRSPRFGLAVAAVVRRLHRTPHVRNVKSPLDPGNAGRISRNGHSALITFEIRGTSSQAKKRVEAALAAVAAVEAAHPSDASLNRAISDSFESDFRRAEATSLPVTLLILVVAFGSLVAAGVPLLLALSAVVAALGLLGPISHLWSVLPRGT